MLINEDLKKMIKNGMNIKIIIRHSNKHDMKDCTVEEKINEAPLTQEGRKMAECLGKSLNVNIGTISSSYRKRCIDTCQEIIKGYRKNHMECNYKIIKSRMLEKPHCRNVPEEHETWKKLGMSGLFDCFANNIEALGFYNLNTSVNRMLDYIFSIGNINNTVDIFCTHGLHIAMLLLYFNKDDKNYKEKLFISKDNWPLMLESMFLWKYENNYNVIWREQNMKYSPNVA